MLNNYMVLEYTLSTNRPLATLTFSGLPLPVEEESRGILSEVQAILIEAVKTTSVLNATRLEYPYDTKPSNSLRAGIMNTQRISLSARIED